MEHLREEVTKLNECLMTLIENRKSVITKIQSLKDAQNIESFDIERERFMFNHLRGSLMVLSKKELLAFSLMMESQAGESYPKWSEFEHLSEHNHFFHEMINPLLVKLLMHSDFEKLSLNKQFSALRANL